MLTRWSDVDQTLAWMNDLQRRMNRLFYEAETGGWPTTQRLSEAAWPPVNLYDHGEELVIEAQVPGMTDKDLRITGNQEVLTISGERKVQAPEGYSVHRQERGGVKFSRSFTFPSKVDMEKTTATVKDGLLTIKLAKAAEAKPRQITVKAK